MHRCRPLVISLSDYLKERKEYRILKESPRFLKVVNYFKNMLKHYIGFHGVSLHYQFMASSFPSESCD